MILPGSYANGFAPRDGQPLYPELWRGCVGAWAPCLGPTGLTLRDWSGRCLNGTLTGMDGNDWIANAGRYALDFDGVNDYVDCNSSLGQLDGSTAFTLCFWGRRRVVGAALTVGKRSGASLISIAPWIDGNVYFQISPNFPSVASNSINWSCYAMTLSGSVIRGYIDGRQAVSSSGPSTVPTVAANYVIGLEQGIARFSDGFIDDVRVYSRALSAKEISILSSRRGIAYELAPRRRSALVAGFNRRRRLLVGAGS